MRTFNSITSIFLLLHLSIHLQAYTPVVNFTISCGATGKSFDGERTWSGDRDSKLLSLQDGTVYATATTQSPSTKQIPYTTARLSRSQFSYSFPVTTGPQFLRLFYHPAQYPSFSRNDASFTVKANQFTLLKDFNASLTADAEYTETIFREYIVNVDDTQRLNLSFTPTQPNSYAFINGIEILSMPNDLYYTSENDYGMTLVGHNTQYTIESSVALETAYRVKVGGQRISPGNDVGLFRDWTGHDELYLRTPSALGSLPGDYGNRNITVKPDYVAPTELYRTARDMGRNATLNKSLNLTWEFPVDSRFNYMLRLHFCELDPNINDISDRSFTIYIGSQVAEERADVLRWTKKQKGIAVHTDYAVLYINSNHKKVNLSLQMHPYTDAKDTLYSDPFLNGVEIFKISDPGSNNLAGPNPDPIPLPPNDSASFQNSKDQSNTVMKIIGVVVAVVSGVVLISSVVFFLVLLRRKITTKTTTRTCKRSPFSFSMTKSTSQQSPSLPSDLCRPFSLVEIKAATKNFNDVFIVDVGGFGHVYKGYIDGGSTPVAIKRLKPASQQGVHEFVNEIVMLSHLRHLHLVSLIGYCNESNEMILVYDFVARGTLRDHLYNNDNPPLSWKQRLQICIGAARGLHYLHTGSRYTIIHRDVKTANILLDEKWVAKVSDFGLSRIGPTGMSKAHISTVVKGTVGYIDPEYYRRHRLTEKSDVYSFGVVLFEILSARPPLIRTSEKKQISLADWARTCYQSGTVAQIVDPTLKGSIAPECMKKFCEIGVSCLLDDGTLRPSMNDVVGMLEFALQLQESAEQRENTVVGIGMVVNENIEDNDDVFSSGTNVWPFSDSNKNSSGVRVTTSSGEH